MTKYSISTCGNYFKVHQFHSELGYWQVTTKDYSTSAVKPLDLILREAKRFYYLQQFGMDKFIVKNASGELELLKGEALGKAVDEAIESSGVFDSMN